MIAVVAVALAISVVCLQRGYKGRTVEIPLNKPSEMSVQRGRKSSRDKIMVHVSGEVHRSGVLELGGDSRVKDALDLAGPTENADLSAMNLAAHIIDGERLVVPAKKAPRQTGEPATGPLGGAKINVNSADQRQLESLPGIGRILAGRIIEFREKQKFETVDHLLQVKGIGPKILERIRDYVCVE